MATGRMLARGPEDLLAFVPVALGFVPHHSLVMVAIGKPGPHARVALPACDEDAHLVFEQLRLACHRHDVTRVALLCHAEDPSVHRWRVCRVGRLLARAGIAVHEVVAASPDRWWTWGPDPEDDTGPVEGHPYDHGSHPFRASAVLHGRMVLGSRDELVGALRSDPDAVRATSRAWGRHPQPSPAPGESTSAWVGALLARHARARTVPGPTDRARVFGLMQESGTRDVMWAPIEREAAAGHVDLWAALARAARPEHRAMACAVTAYLAWLSGSGALAWVAVEASEAAGGCVLAGLVRRLLEEAVAPYSGVRERATRGA